MDFRDNVRIGQIIKVNHSDLCFCPLPDQLLFQPEIWVFYIAPD